LSELLIGKMKITSAFLDFFLATAVAAPAPEADSNDANLRVRIATHALETR
jgi:hypothetical protein